MANNNVETKFKLFFDRFNKIKTDHTTNNKGFTLDKYNTALTNIDTAISELDQTWSSNGPKAYEKLQEVVSEAFELAAQQERPTVIFQFLRSWPTYLKVENRLQQLLHALSSSKIQSLEQEITILRTNQTTTNKNLSKTTDDLRQEFDALKVRVATMMAGVAIYYHLMKDHLKNAKPVINDNFSQGLAKSILRFIQQPENFTAYTFGTQLGLEAQNYQQVPAARDDSKFRTESPREHVLPDTSTPTGNGINGNHSQITAPLMTPIQPTVVSRVPDIAKPQIANGNNSSIAQTVTVPQTPINSKPSNQEAPQTVVKKLFADGHFQKRLAPSHSALVGKIADYANNSVSETNKHIAAQLLACILRFEKTSDFDKLLDDKVTVIQDKELAGLRTEVKNFDLTLYRQSLKILYDTGKSNYETSDFRNWAKTIGYGFQEGITPFPKEGDKDKPGAYFRHFAKKTPTDLVEVRNMIDTKVSNEKESKVGKNSK